MPHSAGGRHPTPNDTAPLAASPRPVRAPPCALRAPDYHSAHVQDLYESLGVRRDASAEELKKAYRRLTRQYHPDRNPGDKAAEEKFKVASSAYDVLGDPERRKLYDEFGDVSLTQGFDADRAREYRKAQARYSGFRGDNLFANMGEARSTSFDDLLSRLFGGGFNQAQAPVRPGHDIRGEITVSFIDALHGVSVPLRLEGEQTKTLDVRVPPGMSDGATLRLRGQGGAGNPPGDILLTVHVKPHPRIERDGIDLRMPVPVTALEAYRGGPIDVPTPWGPVTVKLPAGSQSGQALRLRGRGVRPQGKPDGDMLLTLEIKLPKPGDARLIDLLTELQGNENPREGLEP